MRTLRGSTSPFEHEAANARVDRRKVAMEDLLRVMGLRGDMRTFAKLEHGLEHGGDIATGSDDCEPIVRRRRRERFGSQLPLDRASEAADVLALAALGPQPRRET